MNLHVRYPRLELYKFQIYPNVPNWDHSEQSSLVNITEGYFKTYVEDHHVTE